MRHYEYMIKDTGMVSYLCDNMMFLSSLHRENCIRIACLSSPKSDMQKKKWAAPFNFSNVISLEIVGAL